MAQYTKWQNHFSILSLEARNLSFQLGILQEDICTAIAKVKFKKKKSRLFGPLFKSYSSSCSALYIFFKYHLNITMFNNCYVNNNNVYTIQHNNVYISRLQRILFSKLKRLILQMLFKITDIQGWRGGLDIKGHRLFF